MKVIVEEQKEMELNSTEQLIFELLFSPKSIFNIDLVEYCSFENRPIFRDEIRNVVIKGGIKILDDRIIHTNESTIWKLELKK